MNLGRKEKNPAAQGDVGGIEGLGATTNIGNMCNGGPVADVVASEVKVCQIGQIGKRRDVADVVGTEVKVCQIRQIGKR